MSEDRAVTIAEAAQRLGVSERTIRRLIARPETQAQLRQERRRTVTGERRATVLSAGVLESLQEEINAGTNAAQNRQEERQNEGMPARVATVSVVAAEVADLREKLAATSAQAQMLERERESLRADLADAKAALTREQETAAKLADRLADADARLAAVLVRQLPAADTGAGQDAASASQTPEAGEGRRGEGAGDRSAALHAAEAKPPSFWARLLGRR